MLRFAKHLVVVVLFVLFAGCSGGGCSSGCSCGGVTPLAEGFDPARRIENSASVRLTDSGLGFLQDNLGPLSSVLLGNMGNGGVITFEVPPTSGSQFGISYDVCPNGADPNSDPKKCVAEIDLANAQLTLTPTPDHNLVITGPLPVRLQDLPIHITYFFIPSTIHATLTGNDACPAPANGQTFANIDLNVNVSIEIDPDTAHSRYGYSRLRINAGIDQNQLENSLRICGGFDATILNSLIGIVGGLLIDPLIGTIDSQLEQAFCQQANPDLNPTCPTGTTDVNGICRYGANESDECASMILGMDGNIDLGGLLASFSPGTKGAFDFLFAVGGHNLRDDGSGFHWGDLNPINSGVTLGMYGGAEPTNASGCVTPVDIALPDGIPIPDELLGNTVPDWPMGSSPHVGFALSERFTNYALTQAYNSGALCLGITADALGPSVPLNTSLVGVGLGAPSMNEIGRQKQQASIAIAVRPQQPPHIEFGNGTDASTDPLLRITLPQAAFDFYGWSLDRYVRMFTATMDLDIPINLMAGPDGLEPVIDNLGVSNASVTNSTLLREDPATIAAALEGLLGSLVGSALGGALPAVNLNDMLASLGLTLDIPPSVAGQGSPGLRLLTKGSDDYLGIFASFGLAQPPMMAMGDSGTGKAKGLWGKNGLLSDTQAELVGLDVDPNGLSMATYTRDNGPRATIYMGSDLDNGAQAVEWQYRLDKGPWHSFTRERYLTIQDEWLRTQGRHTVYVRSRVVGDIYSLDPTPAEVTLRVDVQEPVVKVHQMDDGSVSIDAWDAVSGDHDTDVRMRFGRDDGGEVSWAGWSTWMPANTIATLWPDDAGWIEVEAVDEEGLVGTVQQPLLRGRASSAGGCSCTLPGGKTPRSGHHWGWLLSALAAAAVWMRRRKGKRSMPSARRASVAVLFVLAGGLSGCSCGDDAVLTECRLRGDCKTLAPGLIGAYTSAAAAPDGSIWVAGYLEANWEEDLTFGDLVVGRLGSDGEVGWKVIDGLPTDEVVNADRYDPKGFRGGLTDSGDDVGLWTSIAMDDAGKPGVAYYDASHRALRYAHLDGDAWAVNVVQRVEAADVGRYAKLTYLGNVPVIAYNFIEPGDGGAITSGVRLATGSTAQAGATTWNFQEVDSNPATPCRAYLCSTGTACVVSTGICTPKSNDCAADCGSDECVDAGGSPQCEAVFGTSTLDTYPDALGLYVAAAKRPDGSLGLAYYDRIGGNLKVAIDNGGSWAPIIVDGEDGMGNDTGDKGIGASLAVDGNDVFHISYVDGLNEGLSYVSVAGGVTPATPEVADDGIIPGEGQHLVGDDSNILVTQGGDVRISYQDATSGELKLAVGTPGGMTRNWSVQALAQDGFAGFFSRQVETGTSITVLNWWRVATPAAKGNVRAVTP